MFVFVYVYVNLVLSFHLLTVHFRCASFLFSHVPHQLFCIEMEIIPEGVHFRLVQDDELPAILGYLKQYLPESIKVCAILPLSLFLFMFMFIYFINRTTTSIQQHFKLIFQLILYFTEQNDSICYSCYFWNFCSKFLFIFYLNA